MTGSTQVRRASVTTAGGSPTHNALATDLLLKAHKELHEKPEWRERDIEALRSLVLDVPRLRADTSDAMLLKFLRCCKFDYDNALSLLVRYYQTRHKYPEIFTDLTPAAVRSVLKCDIFDVPNLCDYHGARLLVVDLNCWSPSVHSTDELLAALLCVCEYLSAQEYVQVNGLTVILDARALSLSAFFAHKDALRKLIACTQNTFPLRLKAVHIIHDLFLWDSLIVALKSLFMSEKIRQRLHFHNIQNLEQSMEEFLDREVLTSLNLESAASTVESSGGRCRRPVTVSHSHLLTDDDDQQYTDTSSTNHQNGAVITDDNDASTRVNNLCELLMLQQAIFERQSQFGFTCLSASGTEVRSVGGTGSASLGDSVIFADTRPQGCHMLFAGYKRFCIDSLN